MEVIEPREIMKGFRRVDLRSSGSAELRGALDDIRRVRARLDRAEAEVARRLETVTSTPERDVANGAQRSNRHGAKVVARAAALASNPSFAGALDEGTLSGEHVDAFAKVVGGLDGPVKAGLAEAAPQLIRAAATSGSTPEEFTASLTAAAERLAADGGIGRLERQRRGTRLRTWTDRATGMFRLAGSFDPESGARLHGRLEAAIAAMFATRTPSTAPSDPGEKQDHLRALALLALAAGVGASRPTQTASSHGTDEPDVPDVTDAGNEWETFSTSLGNTVRRFGRPEVTVVIDTTALDPNGKPTADWGIPITIPWQRIQHLCRTAHVRPVIIHDGSVVDRRRPQPRTKCTFGEQGPTASPFGDLCHMRRTRLQRVVHSHQTSSRALVATRWADQPRQPPSTLQPPPPLRQRTWLGPHARTRSATHHRAPRRTNHANRPAPTHALRLGSGTVSSESVGPPGQSSTTAAPRWRGVYARPHPRPSALSGDRPSCSSNASGR